MEVECIKDKLTDAVSKTERITGKNLTLPLLKCVLITAKDSSLIIRATNLDIGIEIEVASKIKEEGTVAVPADVLKSYLTNLKGDNKVHLKQKENTLTIKTSNSNTQLKTLDHSEFPSIPSIDEKKSTTLTLSAPDLVSGFKSVSFSASTSSMKPELSSVYCYFDKSNIVFVATDSFRLAEKRVYVKKLKEFDPVLIPIQNVSDITRTFDDVKEKIEIDITDSQISFSSPSTYITSRVVDGVFPDYKQIIPKEHETSVVTLKQEIQDVLKLSNVLSDKFNQLTFIVDPGEKAFQIKTINPDLGEHVSDINASLEGEPTEISFNYRYVFDGFSPIYTDSVSLSFEKGKPMILKGVGDKTFMYLVMPMNK